MPVSTSLPPELVRETATAVVNRPYYKLDFDHPANGGLWQTLLDWLAFMLAPLHSVLETLGTMIASILRPILVLFQSLYAMSPLLAWGLATLLAGGLILWGIHRARSTRRGRAAAPSTAHTNGATRPADLEAAAARAAARGDYIVSVRALFAASLLRLAERQNRGVSAGATNREVLQRYRHTSVFPLLAVFVDLIDTKWYGRGRCNRDDVHKCEGAYREIRRLAVEGNYAEHA